MSKKHILSMICAGTMVLSFAYTFDSAFNEPSVLTAFAADETITENLTLSKDMTVDGDLVLTEDVTLSLNGYTLTVKGDLNQKSGTLNVETGTLNVGGSYINSYSRDNAGSGVLNMGPEGGSVNIGGDYFQWSNGKSTLSYGVMKIGGNFEGSKSGGQGGFDAWNLHTVCFTGDNIHEIYFNSENSYNQFCKVSMTGNGQLLLKGETNGFYAASDLVFADGSELNEGAALKTEGHTLTAAGDFILKGTIDLGEGVFNVKGDLNQKSGTLNVETGTLNVGGSYINSYSRDSAGSGVLNMGHEGGSVNIGGDYFQWSNGKSTLSYGVMKIGGNFEGSKSGGQGGFDAWNVHTVCFTGDNIHEIYFNTENSYNQFCKVSMTGNGQLLLKGKTNGFYAASDLVFADGSELNEGAALRTEGHTLTAAGDFILKGTIDLGEGVFNVKGDLNQKSGTLNVETGTLNVGGSYINSYSRDSAGTGVLNMGHEGGKTVIGGDYFQWSSGKSTLSYGIMAVYGNFEGSKSGGQGGFDAWNVHTIAFLGGKEHTIYLNSSNGYNQLNFIRMGVGDSITFLKELNAIENGKSISVSPDTIASVNEKTVIAKAEGEGTIAFTNASDRSESRKLIVGVTDIPAPFDGSIPTPSTSVKGDVNGDGVFNISDAVLLQKWLLAVPDTHLADWRAADLCSDNRLDVFDLCLMKRDLLQNTAS